MKFTNKYNLPKAMVEALKKNMYDLTNPKPNVISVTTLINPPRIRQLTTRHWDEIEVDVSDMFWMLMGSCVHEVLSRIEGKNMIIEERLEEEVNGIIVSGKPDNYGFVLLAIRDWKFTSVWAVKQLKPEHEKQINSYAWLYRMAKFVVEKGFINALLKDWRKTEKLRYGNDYPSCPFKQLKVPIWPIEQQQKYIEERVELHKKAEKLSDKDLPICSPEERWTKATTYAVYKNNNKTASGGKVCDSEKEAKEFIEAKMGDGHTYRIEKRPGQEVRCEGYCNVNKFCNFYKENGEKKNG